MPFLTLLRGKERMKLGTYIHSHVHSEYDYAIGRTRVICNPRGYPDDPNEGFIPDLVIEI